MDHTNIKTKIFVMLPVIFAIVLLGLANNIEFKDAFSPVEMQIIKYKYRPLKIHEQQAAEPVRKILKGPLYPDPLDSGYEILRKSGRSDSASETDDPEVSLIIISGSSKMAIIQGVLVKEGDLFYDTRVVKIEPERVLLKNKKNKWIYVKK